MPEPGVEPPFKTLADLSRRIAHEADIAARPGQMVRLQLISDELYELAERMADHAE